MRVHLSHLEMGYSIGSIVIFFAPLEWISALCINEMCKFIGTSLTKKDFILVAESGRLSLIINGILKR